MKIIVLGSGLIGVTTAYELARRGAEVIVIDRQSESAAETSFANGGQLSYTHAEPWASPSTLLKLPKWLIHSDSPLVLKPRADWQMIRWMLLFMQNCTPQRSIHNCINLLRLGLYSRRKMQQLRDATGIAFDFNNHGILHIFSTEKERAHAERQYEFQAKFGSLHRMLSREECIVREPSLAQARSPIIGGMHAPLDESGDCYLFTKNLAHYASEHLGVKLHYGITVHGLRTEEKRIVAVETSIGDIVADGYVMALGSYSSIYLREIGIDIPVYPMKGYSITVEAGDQCTQSSIMDLTHKVALTRLGSRLRVAGTAELAGYDTSINEKRVRPIVAATKKLFPNVDWTQEIGKWACLRAATPSGVPILGRTRYANLFLNTGHGTLGWTQAAGSATIVADCMEGKTPEIMTHGFTLS